MKTRLLSAFVFSATASAALLALTVSARCETTDLRSAFTNPPPDTRPGCYWYWINDNVSKEGITKDLEAMARVGIGRAYIGHIFGQGERWETPVGKVPFMSDAWWDAVQWAGKIGIGEKGGIVFKHRSTPDREIYFLSNTTGQAVEFTTSLRVSGRQPELWNADTGTIAKAVAFTQRDGRTQVPLRLDASESIFLVFGAPIPPRCHRGRHL